jgi:hypothetical protein
VLGARATEKIITPRVGKKLNGGSLIISAVSAIYLLLLGLGQKVLAKF